MGERIKLSTHAINAIDIVDSRNHFHYNGGVGKYTHLTPMTTTASSGVVVFNSDTLDALYPLAVRGDHDGDIAMTKKRHKRLSNINHPVNIGLNRKI